MKETAQSTQFLKVLKGEDIFVDTNLTPSDYKNVCLTKKEYKDGLDLMKAWDGDYHHAEAENIFLGHYREKR
jgi:hypothetical protein